MAFSPRIGPYVQVLVTCSPILFLLFGPRPRYFTPYTVLYLVVAFYVGLVITPKGLRPTLTVPCPSWGLSSSIDIDADAQHVWSILLDLDSYLQWNTFTPCFDGWPHRLSVGDRGYHEVAFEEGGKRRRARIEINELDHEDKRMCHKSIALPSPLLYIERQQQVIDLGDRRCRFEQCAGADRSELIVQMERADRRARADIDVHDETRRSGRTRPHVRGSQAARRGNEIAHCTATTWICVLPRRQG